VYRLVHTPEALDQLEALPPEALAPYAELLALLELTPWNGESQNSPAKEMAPRVALANPRTVPTSPFENPRVPVSV
jgi:hypothetical protein